MMILNQTEKHPFGDELFCIKSFFKILAKFLEKKKKKSCGRLVFLSNQKC